MKNIQVMVWAYILMLGVTACGGGDNPPTTDNDSGTAGMTTTPDAGPDEGMDDAGMGDAGMGEDSAVPLVPQVDAGEDQSGSVGAQLELRPAIDAGTDFTVSWSGEGLEFADAAAADTTVSAEAPGEYTATLTVTVGDESASDSLRLTFDPAPELVLSAGLQLFPNEQGTVAVTAPGNGSVTWTGEDAIFGDADQRSTTVSYAEAGDYEVTATWTDGEITITGTIVVRVVTTVESLRLLIVGTDNGADQTLATWLESRKHAVTVQEPSTSADEVDLDAYDVLLISSSIDSASLHPSWYDVDMKMLVWEFFALPQLGMGSNPQATEAGGTAYPYERLLIEHPLTAGHSGTIRLSAVGRTLYAEPAENAIILGEATDARGGEALGKNFFAFEPGMLSSGFTTSERRVVMPLGLTLAEGLTADGKDLVEAALAWVVGAGILPRPRVMALGDSITRGTHTSNTITNSYREPLTAMLDDAQCRYDMVGTQTGSISGEPSVLFDWDHEGHGGFTTTQIRGGLLNYVDGNRPDVVLVHLGTNDLLQSVTLTTSESNLLNIATNLRAQNANVVIMLAQLIPANYLVGSGQAPEVEALAAGIPAYNDMLSTFAATHTTEASPIVLIDLNSDFPLEQLDNDGIHPLPGGESFMAEAWYAELSQQLTCANP